MAGELTKFKPPSGEYAVGRDIADCESVTVTDWYTRVGHFQRIADGPIEFKGENPVVLFAIGSWPWENK